MLRYAITDRARLPGAEPDRQAGLLRQAARWAADGLDIVQLREKDLPSGVLADLARGMLAVLRAHHPAPRLLLNSRADVAVAAGADGVHLTAAAGELTPVQVRTLYAAAALPEPTVSVSCHTLAEVAAARKSGATLILFGPVFEKRVGGQLVADGTGLDRLRAACAAAGPTPVLALGGVTWANAEACGDAGAAGIAAIRLFQGESSA
jgi:thiamine-phosphate pyrophosphorylase